MGRMCPASPKGVVMRRLFLIPTLVVAVMMTIIATGSASSAQGDGLTIPASTVISGNAGDVIELGRIPVDTARAGPLCTWQATVMNQTSVHPNTDILLESNGTTLVLADVEAVPNKVTSNSGSVFLADEVVVSVRLGPLGLFSGRMEVTIDYSKCQPTTTSTSTSTTELSPVTTAEVSTTQSTTESTPTPTSPTVVETSAETTVVETSTETTEDTQVEGPEVSATDTTVVSTTAETTVTTTATASEELPVTGSSFTLPLFVAGTVILAAGLVLTSGVRRRQS